MPALERPILSARSGLNRTLNLIDWFVPAEYKRRRSDWELARTFVFTHLFGPLIAQPMWIYLYIVLPAADTHLYVLTVGSFSFCLLPILLRLTGTLSIAALISFQGLAAISLYGSYYYGGLGSPFAPWLIISLLLGIFYHPKNLALILVMFSISVLVFLALIWDQPREVGITSRQMEELGWLSMAAAMIYMTWMAFYYSAVVSLRSELEIEAHRNLVVSQELEQAQRDAEQKGRERGQFFAKMSHELRTPLHAIIGLSELMLDDVEDVVTTGNNRKEDVRRISAAANHLLSLVAEVLDTDVMASGSTEIHPSTFELGGMCDEVLANALPLVKANGNQFTLSCPEPETQVHTDANKLRQVVINLLSNAGKFTTNGEVTLEIHIDRGRHESQLQIIVRDTGVGISQNALSRLFTPYDRGDNFSSTKTHGTGLGLALSRELCILLGGNITVESRVGYGSTFTISVPASIDKNGEPVNSPESVDQVLT